MGTRIDGLSGRPASESVANEMRFMQIDSFQCKFHCNSIGINLAGDTGTKQTYSLGDTYSRETVRDLCVV